MNNNWRFTAVSITKYRPDNNQFKDSEWVGFFQIGKEFNGQILTFESYAIVENLYIQAAVMFLEFHNCRGVYIKNLEKNDFESYRYKDRDELINVYNHVAEGIFIPVSEIGSFIKLILREIIWGELYCGNSNNIVLRFGYDFYMYLNSDQDLKGLLEKIESIGLYVNSR